MLLVTRFLEASFRKAFRQATIAGVLVFLERALAETLLCIEVSLRE